MSKCRIRPSLEFIRNQPGVTISNAMAAAAMAMEPSRLAEYARKGELQWKVIPSGNTWKHSKDGFVKFWSGEEVEKDA